MKYIEIKTTKIAHRSLAKSVNEILFQLIIIISFNHYEILHLLYLMLPMTKVLVLLCDLLKAQILRLLMCDKM